MRWRLPGPARDVGGLAHGAIDGYVARPSLAPGEVQRIFVSAPGAHQVRIALFRMGWYGGRGGREVLNSRWLGARRQPPCAHDVATGLTQCRWHPTLSFAIPPALASGVYVARLSSDRGAARDCLFVVQAARPAPLLAQLPTATYEAYNAWGGDSLYPGGARTVELTGTTQGLAVSYDRPYASVTGAGEFFARDVAMVRFLERYGYPVSYTDSESVASAPGQLRGHRALLDFGHSEYWSQGQADAWAHQRDGGTSLLFLSSDTVAWRVRFAAASPASSESGRAAQVIVAYKEHSALDRDRAQPSGAFADFGAALTGSAYTGCITPRLPGPGPPAYRYYDWSPAPGLQPAWLFAGSGVNAATRIPGITGYELDERTARSPAATAVVGAGTGACMSVAPGSGEPVPGTRAHHADTTLYTARSGALVFATGTLGWELGLEPIPSASPDAPAAPDPRLVAVTRNLLDHVLGRR
jgi:N,N-dimethylformamidase beta subunit-like protein